ncbi:MAG: agmatinase [Candidatus Dadabacteria bacterium]|nr:agmatinase [Candidatus Dadabacteria bacterium]MCY4042891.1 agmatinase [Candidatus Dadabacteria bacterium]
MSFSNLNFLGLDEAGSGFEEAAVAVIPVPYERTVSFRAGCSRGPLAIIQASRSLELYDEEFELRPSDCGIHTAPELECDISPESMTRAVRETCLSAARAGKFVVTLGGEHSVTLGAFSAQKEIHPDVSVLSVDAHCDLRDSYQGSKFSHACVMRRVLETGARVTVAGARSMSSGEAEFARGREGLTVIPARETAGGGGEAVARVVESLGERVYLSIDADGLDPALMPAVGTPEPGGFGWEEITALLAAVFARREVVGMDFVELCPIDGMCAPEVTAARLIQKAIGYKFGGRAAGI